MSNDAPAVVYCSPKLSPVVLGMPVAFMIDKSVPVLLASDCVAHVPHSVLHILNTYATQHMTAACRSGYEVVIFLSPHISVKRSPPLNPATYLPHLDFEVEHDYSGWN